MFYDLLKTSKGLIFWLILYSARHTGRKTLIAKRLAVLPVQRLARLSVTEVPSRTPSNPIKPLSTDAGHSKSLPCILQYTVVAKSNVEPLQLLAY